MIKSHSAPTQDDFPLKYCPDRRQQVSHGGRVRGQIRDAASKLEAVKSLHDLRPAPFRAPADERAAHVLRGPVVIVAVQDEPERFREVPRVSANRTSLARGRHRFGFQSW